MDFEGIMLSEIIEREKILYDFTYMWDLYKKKSPRNGDQTCGCQRQRVGERETGGR